MSRLRLECLGDGQVTLKNMETEVDITEELDILAMTVFITPEGPPRIEIAAYVDEFVIENLGLEKRGE